MVRFYINFTLTINQRHPEIIHKLQFSRQIDDDRHWWDPLPQIGSTILIPFIQVFERRPSFVDTVYKTPCKVTDIIQELDGYFSYTKTMVCCEATCDLGYIQDKHSISSVAGFITLLEDRGWSIVEHVEG